MSNINWAKKYAKQKIFASDIKMNKIFTPL